MPTSLRNLTRWLSASCRASFLCGHRVPARLLPLTSGFVVSDHGGDTPRLDARKCPLNPRHPGHCAFGRSPQPVPGKNLRVFDAALAQLPTVGRGRGSAINSGTRVRGRVGAAVCCRRKVWRATVFSQRLHQLEVGSLVDPGGRG
jgi:hypothetical protein